MCSPVGHVVKAMRRNLDRPPADPDVTDLDLEPAMNHATALNLEDNLMLRLLALAMEKVQRRRVKPKKKGSLHRV
jgi:hypothetical protein